MPNGSFMILWFLGWVYTSSPSIIPSSSRLLSTLQLGEENKNKIHSYTFDPRVKSMQNGLTWMTFCDPTISTISRFGLQNVVNKTIEGIVQSEYFSALQTMLEKHSRHSKKAPWRIPSMTAWRRSNWLNQSPIHRIMSWTILGITRLSWPLQHLVAYQLSLRSCIQPIQTGVEFPHKWRFPWKIIYKWVIFHCHFDYQGVTDKKSCQPWMNQPFWIKLMKGLFDLLQKMIIFYCNGIPPEANQEFLDCWSMKPLEYSVR